MQKKIRPVERNDLELFLKLQDSFDVEVCESSDSPDLIIKGTEPLIGVEHTRIFRSNPELPSGRQLRPQERIQHQITDRARETFRKDSSLALYLAVSFSEPSDYRIRDVLIIGDELAKSVSQTLRLLGESAHRDQDIMVEDWDMRHRGYPFPRGVDSFHFKIERNPAYELWGPAYGYAVPSLSIADVSATIEHKETRIDEYKSRCESIWLLIVTDAGMPSSHYDVPPEVVQYRYETRFDRVFLMTCFHRALYELGRREKETVDNPAA